MSRLESVRDATKADGMAIMPKPETKVDRSHRGEPLPPVAQVGEPATAEEEEE